MSFRLPLRRTHLLGLVAALLACEPFSAPLEKNSRSVSGCTEAVDHLRACCPAWNSYLSCTYLANERASPDLTDRQSRCLSKRSCAEIQQAIEAGDRVCELSSPTRQCR
jgi:hypothetical protein